MKLFYAFSARILFKNASTSWRAASAFLSPFTFFFTDSIISSAPMFPFTARRKSVLHASFPAERWQIFNDVPYIFALSQGVQFPILVKLIANI